MSYLARKYHRSMLVGMAALAISALAGCDDTTAKSSDQKMNQAQEALADQAVMSVGMPAIINFQEKRMMKDIIEARDNVRSTYTYIVAEQTGQLFKVCDSMGYGLPYATQFTNPQKVSWLNRSGGGYSYLAMPQADPNGLFSPAAAEGTWVMCNNPVKPTENKPVYIEPKIIVSPFPITLTPVPFGKPQS